MKNNICIMVIDDEPIVGKRLKTVLEKAGYSVDTFTEGSSALRELEKKQFHIIITDLKMEGIDGMQVLEKIRNTNPEIKVIIITGYGKKATAQEALNMGAFAFLTKPFRIEELKQLIRKAVADSGNQ